MDWDDNIVSYLTSIGNVFYGQVSPRGEYTAEVVGRCWSSPMNSWSRPKPGTDNSVRDSISNWLAGPPTLYMAIPKALPPERRLYNTNRCSLCRECNPQPSANSVHKYPFYFGLKLYFLYISLLNNLIDGKSHKYFSYFIINAYSFVSWEKNYPVGRNVNLIWYFSYLKWIY